MNLRSNKRQAGEVSTSALNDILFILLFFFLIIATLANPNVIKLAIPKATTDTKAKQTVVVSIDENQNFYVGTQATSEDGLQAALREAIQKSSDAEPTIVINAAKTATANQIVTVMKNAQVLKVRTVLAVEKE